jgi:hypothetical protein
MSPNHAAPGADKLADAPTRTAAREGTNLNAPRAAAVDDHPQQTASSGAHTHQPTAPSAALMDNAATMPTVVLSELLGLSIIGATGNAYAANITHRQRAQYPAWGCSRLA